MSFPTPPRTSLAAALLLLAGALPAAADSTQRYGYYRVVDGSANLVQDDATVALQENHPLVTGDRLWTGGGSRVEVELPDGTVLRVGGQAEISFEELAASGDTGASSTLLYLDRGELQVVTESTYGAEAYPRIDTPNSSIYLEGAGSYRVEARDGLTRVAVRSGAAEVMTRRGATRLGPDQEAWIEGTDSQRVEVEAAAGWTALERWGSALDEQVRRAGLDDSVDGRLRYGASRMNDYGSWVDVERRRAWRPRVGSDWSPYRHGRWAYTPSGLTWVSYEPWGWVPYHYGSWDYAPGWGWVWYPGAVYAPAWVYWYWGPSHVGWCPVGYYYRHYGRPWHARYGWDFGLRFRFGVHGWAGGGLRHWDRWNFVDCRRIGDHRLAIHTRTASQLGQGLRELPRGVIATDTRELRTAIATRPSGAMRHLAERRGAGELPDVTRFIAREPGLPADVTRFALPIDPDGVGGASLPGRSAEKPIPAAGRRVSGGSVPGDFVEPVPAAGAGREARGAVGRTRPGASGGATAPGGFVDRRVAPPARSGEEAGGQAVPRRPAAGGAWSPAPPSAGSAGADQPAASGRTRPPAARGATPGDRPDGAARAKPTGRPPGASASSGAPPAEEGARNRTPAEQPPSWRSRERAPQERTKPLERTAPPNTRARPPAEGSDSGGEGSGSAVRRRVAPPDEGAWRSQGVGGSSGAERRLVPPVRRVVEGLRRPTPPRPSPRPSPEAQAAPSAPGTRGASATPRYRSEPPPSSRSGSASSRSDDGGSRGSSGRASSSDGGRSSGDRGAARTRSRSGDPDRR
jgi:hypothetical protein